MLKRCEICGGKFFGRYQGKGIMLCGKHYMQIKRYGKILKRTIHDKNEIINCKDHYEICLYNIKHQEMARAKIDKDDLDKVKKYKWCLDGAGYVICIDRTNRIVKTIRLHQLIMNQKDNYEIDHKDTDRLNNRKQNLRYATRQQNSRNRKAKGIWFDKSRQKWIVYITINYKKINLGRFKKKEDALKVRKKAIIKYFKEFSYGYK